MKIFINQKGFTRPNFAKQNLGGFTLLEAMIAIFVIAVGILAVLQTFPLSVQSQAAAKMATVVSQLGQEKIEEIIAKSYADISSEVTTTLDSPFGSYSRKVEVTCFDPNGEGLSPDCPDTGIKKVKVAVFWKLPFGITQKSFEIATLISKR